MESDLDDKLKQIDSWKPLEPSEIVKPIQTKDLHQETTPETQSNANYDAKKEELIVWQGELVRREKDINERIRELEEKDSTLARKEKEIRREHLRVKRFQKEVERREENCR